MTIKVIGTFLASFFLIILNKNLKKTRQVAKNTHILVEGYVIFLSENELKIGIKKGENYGKNSNHEIN